MTAPSIKEALELKPCPFCGKQPQSRWHGATGEDDDSGYWGIDCCQAFSHDGMQEDAVNKWNTRAALATLQPSGERREAIARIIDPRAFADFGEVYAFNTRESRYFALAKADELIASGLVQDEAAIRADERERIAKSVECDCCDVCGESPGFPKCANEIAAAIRSARDGGEA